MAAEQAMRLRKNFSVRLLAFLMIPLLGGCADDRQQISETYSQQIELEDAEIPGGAGTQFWHVTNRRLFVLLGYDFNTGAAAEETARILTERYGAAADGGLVETVRYPDDFRHGGKSFVSSLTSMLSDSSKDYAGVLILGAPENTHTALARLQDEWNQEIPFPVAALFPQDDILGLEATCDFVLDKGIADSAASDMSEETQNDISGAAEIITAAADYMLEAGDLISAAPSLRIHIRQMLGSRKFHSYTDPESGLQSVNHFVID